MIASARTEVANKVRGPDGLRQQAERQHPRHDRVAENVDAVDARARIQIVQDVGSQPSGEPQEQELAEPEGDEQQAETNSCIEADGAPSARVAVLCYHFVVPLLR
jgi:hypothetical protein